MKPTMQNPTLEEFSSERFNPIRKTEERLWNEMKPVFGESIPPERIDESNKKAQDYINKYVDDVVENFKSHKDRLDFMLDFLWLHFFTRNLNDTLTKSYRPESKLLQEQTDFDPKSDDLTYEIAFKFLADNKHWMGKLAKTAEEIMKRRGIWGAKDFNYLKYFESTREAYKKVYELATHFVSVLPLPEYFLKIPDKPVDKIPSEILNKKSPNKPLPDGSPAPNRNTFFMKDFKWDKFSFKVVPVSDSDYPRLLEFEYLNRFDREVEVRIRELGEAVAEIDYIDSTGNIPKGVARQGKTWIEFADGSKWVYIEDRSSCPIEGIVMGHCGNKYHNEKPTHRLLSFRVPHPHAEGRFIVKLTFIYNEANNLIGEAKGRANSKPASSLHPYIIQLLLLDKVEGLEQGSHRIENDFSFNDLSKEDLLLLIDKKPTLFSKSKVGRSSIINKGLMKEWQESYEKVTGEKAPKLEDLKFDKNPKRVRQSRRNQ